MATIWTILIAIGAAHGFFLAAVLWQKPENRRANRYFSLLLLSTALHLTEYALSISGAIFDYPHLIFSTYPLLFCMGPLFWFYTLEYLGMPAPKNWRLGLHLLPAFTMFLMLTPFYFLSGSAKIAFFNEATANHFREVPPEQFLIMFGQIAQLTVYLLVSRNLISRKKSELMQFRSNSNLLKINWLEKSTIVFGVFIMAYATGTTVLVVREAYRVETDYAVVLLMAILVYAAGYAALVQPHLFNEPLKTGGGKMTRSDLESRMDQRIPDEELKTRLLQWMDTQKPWLEEDLKLTDLADALETPAHRLSEVLNAGLGLSFFDFVNQYRVNAAKRMLSDPAFDGQKILAVGFDAGFANKATFYRVFKNFTGMTPSEYRTKHK